jgi:predicted small integral membrane protein
MDTAFRGNAAMYRAVTNPAWWHAGYWRIILGEACTGGLLGLGAISLWRHRYASGEVFGEAKRLVIVGAALGFLVWFFGFMVVGGEWFLMWQSKAWNGQEAAFRFYAAILGVLLFVNQQDGDLIPAPVKAPRRER